MNIVFDNYSKYYDLLYKDKDYSSEVDYIYNLINKFAPNSKTILELGCGTGKHARLLKDKYNFYTYGIDASKTMLEQAKMLGIDCELRDVRTFRINKKFDVVSSLFHVVSYQNTDEDVIKMFQTASCHLNSGGIFIFDLWYKPAVLAQLPEKRIKIMENDKIKVTRHCNPNHIKSKSIVEVNYIIDILDKSSNKISQLKETHSMRYFSKEEIESFAKQCNIKIKNEEEWLTGNAPSEKSWGVCFVGEKE